MKLEAKKCLPSVQKSFRISQATKLVFGELLLIINSPGDKFLF
jgi:hypothetical protein